VIGDFDAAIPGRRRGAGMDRAPAGATTRKDSRRVGSGPLEVGGDHRIVDKCEDLLAADLRFAPTGLRAVAGRGAHLTSPLACVRDAWRGRSAERTGEDWPETNPPPPGLCFR
jgi:hypothetical protein